MGDEPTNPLNTPPQEDAGVPQAPQGDVGAVPPAPQEPAVPAPASDDAQGALNVEHQPASEGADAPAAPVPGPAVDAPVEGGDLPAPAPEEPAAGGSDEQTPGQAL